MNAFERLLKKLTRKPKTLAQLVAETGLHPTTVRRELNGLWGKNEVDIGKAPPTGKRGRPALTYAEVP